MVVNLCLFYLLDFFLPHQQGSWSEVRQQTISQVHALETECMTQIMKIALLMQSFFVKTQLKACTATSFVHYHNQPIL